nr:guanine nucleotide-binding protein subunit gamma 3-like [Ipomoea batatas]
MSGSERGGGVASLPPPQPRSPPLCRRELAKVQVLEREVGFLEVTLRRRQDPLVSGNGSAAVQHRVPTFHGFAVIDVPKSKCHDVSSVVTAICAAAAPCASSAVQYLTVTAVVAPARALVAALRSPRARARATVALQIVVTRNALPVDVDAAVVLDVQR